LYSLRAYNRLRETRPFYPRHRDRGTFENEESMTQAPSPGDLSAGRLPVLYSFRRCPYAMRARLALAVSQTRCELREVVLKDKPPQLREASAKATVPILLLADGTVLEQSLDILYWALRRHDPEGWLAPGPAAASLIARCDEEFKFHLDRYKYAARHEPGEGAVHRAAAAACLEEWNRRIEPGGYLCGNRRSIADVAIAPFVRQFAAHDSAWFASQPWAPLQTWLAAFAAWPLFALSMRKYTPWSADRPATFFPD
jgi:glutathione S-transferase